MGFFDASVTETVREQFANLIGRERIRAKSLEDTMVRIQYDIDHTEHQLRTALQENDLAATLSSKAEVNPISSTMMMAANPNLLTRANGSNATLNMPLTNGKAMAPTVVASPQQDIRVQTMMQLQQSPDKDTAQEESAISNGDQDKTAKLKE